jgi:protein gp37
VNRTSIEWTDFTANPLKFRDASGRVVWGCVHASPGCQHCYAETLAKRYGKGGPFNVPTMNGLTPFLDDAELRKMLTAKRVGGKDVAGSRCFVGDMTDIFGEWVPDALLDHLFSNVFEVRRDVTWQLLTKRADRMHRYLSWRWGGRIPSRNIWVGVSCEDQPRADERIPLLMQTPAVVKFISAEPLLGTIRLNEIDIDDPEYGPTVICPLSGEWAPDHRPPYLGTLDWVIVGGESGAGARPCNVEWIRAIVQQCQGADVACFVKQLGSKPIDTGRNSSLQPGVMLDEYNVRTYPKDRKGGDITEFPTSLRVREFPRSAVVQ